jgi:hypothetical protein
VREKLNENQTAQIALVAVLIVVVGFFAYKNFAGGSESSSEASEPAAAESVPTAATTATGAPPVHKLPAKVDQAYEDGSTVVLLVHRDGGIDDRKVRQAATVLDGMANVAYFPVPVDQIAKYAAITGPLGVAGAPALIVVSPRRLNGEGPAKASVTYGFQTAADITQAVRDADYSGPTLTYAPQ